MTQRRAEQLASVIHRAAQTIVDGLADPRLDDALVTVTRVTVAGDLRDATLFVTVNPESREKLAMHALDSAARHVRRQVGDLVEIRQMPEFHFKVDIAAKKQNRVLEALRKVEQERGQGDAHQHQPPEATEPDGPENAP